MYIQCFNLYYTAFMKYGKTTSFLHVVVSSFATYTAHHPFTSEHSNTIPFLIL